MFLRQLGWELRKLWSRPRSYLGFAACLLFEIALILLYRTTSLDEIVGAVYWKVPPTLATTTLSGLTVATHVTAETTSMIGALFLALVAGDLIANESEERTLHMIFSRPVSRGAVVLQKVIVCVVYTILLCLFVGVTALGIALVVEGPGPVVVFSAKESLIGVHDFVPGLRRYALAVMMLGPCWVTFTLLGFFLSCCRMKPGAATVVATALLLTDHVMRIQPAFAGYLPYSLGTRILTWRQPFAYEVSWLRIERNLSQLFLLDIALILLAWWVFRRRELAP